MSGAGLPVTRQPVPVQCAISEPSTAQPFAAELNPSAAPPVVSLTFDHVVPVQCTSSGPKRPLPIGA